MMTELDFLRAARVHMQDAQAAASLREDELIALLAEQGPFKVGEELCHRRIVDFRPGKTRGRVKRWTVLKVLPAFRVLPDGALSVKYQAQVQTPQCRGKMEVLWSEDYKLWPGWDMTRTRNRSGTAYIS